MLKILVTIAFSGLVFNSCEILSSTYTAGECRSLEQKYGKVIHVSTMFRHGDRTASSDYPLDPYRLHSWTDGRGQLLRRGQQKLIQLGKWFRIRYAEIVKTVTSPTNITVHSSDYDRTIMSAECLMTGFYKPKREEIVDKHLRWQPIPIHAISRECDQVIAFEKPCPAYGFYRRKYFQKSKNMKKLYDRNQKLFYYLQNHTGFELPGHDMLLCEQRIRKIYDTLKVQKENNFTLPAWSKRVFPEPLTSLAARLINGELAWFKPKKLWTGNKSYYLYKQQNILPKGSFFKMITTDMRQRLKHTTRQIFHFYAGHESTMAAIMRALKIFNWIIPPYTSSLIFELRLRNQNSPSITVLFKNTTGDTNLMHLPACNYKKGCSLWKFFEIVEPFLLKDWDTECKIPPQKK